LSSSEADRAVPAACAARDTSFIRDARVAARRARGDRRWCAAVGVPARVTRADQVRIDGAFAVVSWNTHVGAATSARWCAT
jgi:hypothetical protein